MEIWKQITDFPNYEISSFGRVRNTKTGKFKQQTFNKRHKYFYVVLHNNGISKHKKIYRLLAKYFIPNPENKKEVNHVDGFRPNHSILNLEWATASENMQHAYKTGLTNGTFKKGFQHQRKKLNPCDMLYIFAKRLNFEMSLKELSQKFNCTPDHISRVANKKYYEILRAE